MAKLLKKGVRSKTAALFGVGVWMVHADVVCQKPRIGCLQPFCGRVAVGMETCAVAVRICNIPRRNRSSRAC